MYLKTLQQTLFHIDFSPIFSSSFVILRFTFKIIANFVYSVTSVSTFILFPNPGQELAHFELHSAEATGWPA